MAHVIPRRRDFRILMVVLDLFLGSGFSAGGWHKLEAPLFWPGPDVWAAGRRIDRRRHGDAARQEGELSLGIIGKRGAAAADRVYEGVAVVASGRLGRE
ncbi:hypothetical protein G3M48_000464 [Beauveria asiatica]|uniref:Uncharacterized protein n=1 Tax=Beauveria asiatica TaxID=1069075 RepID=A0AAW0S0H9_9HYPO